jgi:putative transposase
MANVLSEDKKQQVIALRRLGWSLDRTLEAELTLQALRQALVRRRPAPGLVHHSDRGVQYASSTFTGLMEEHGIQSSMGRRGNPYDNAGCDDLPEILYQQE